MLQSWFVGAIDPLLKLIGWAFNLRRDRLKARVWKMLPSAGARGLTAEGIQNEFRGDVLGDVKIGTIYGRAPRHIRLWTRIHHRWRMRAQLPTVSQIHATLYEMIKGGTARDAGHRRYTR